MRSESDSVPVAQGEILAGKYRVERVLGAGGMGVVVAARHLQLDQLVALKFVLPSAVDDTMVTERFLREAKAAVRLRSEHVAKVLDVGTLETGAPYIVMEYLEGANLAEVIAHQAPLAAEVACDYLIQACEALSEAHTLGIVHRDLKPQNLFLTKGVGGSALVKVLDFGISKVAQPEGAHNLTQTATVIGSPLYMAPEQMRSARNADARSDIWSLGVVLYEMLGRTLPFEAETITDLAIKIVQEPFTPIEQLRPDLPLDLVAVVRKCLEKSPAARFTDAGELASALEPFAPTASRVVADRARKVISAHSKTMGVSLAPALAARLDEAHAAGPVRATAVSSPTQKSPSIPEAWSETKGKAPPKKGAWVLGLSVAAVAIVLALVGARALGLGRDSTARIEATATEPRESGHATAVAPPSVPATVPPQVAAAGPAPVLSVWPAPSASAVPSLSSGSTARAAASANASASPTLPHPPAGAHAAGARTAATPSATPKPPAGDAKPSPSNDDIPSLR